jgi:hypothetical protein
MKKYKSQNKIMQQITNNILISVIIISVIIISVIINTALFK